MENPATLGSADVSTLGNILQQNLFRVMFIDVAEHELGSLQVVLVKMRLGANLLGFFCMPTEEEPELGKMNSNLILGKVGIVLGVEVVDDHGMVDGLLLPGRVLGQGKSCNLIGVGIGLDTVDIHAAIGMEG